MAERSECEKINDLAYRLGEMSPEEKALYEAHLQGCPLCRDETDIMDAAIQIEIQSGVCCLTDEELEVAAAGGAPSRSRIGRHLRACSACTAEVDAIRYLQHPAEKPPPIPEQLVRLIGELKTKNGAKVIQFPIRRLQPLVPRGQEEQRLAAEEKGKPAPRYERYEEGQTVMVASISLTGDFIVTVERQGRGVPDTKVALEEGSTGGESREIISMPTDQYGQANFGPAKNFSPPRPDWFYRIKVALPNEDVS